MSDLSYECRIMDVFLHLNNVCIKWMDVIIAFWNVLFIRFTWQMTSSKTHKLTNSPFIYVKCHQPTVKKREIYLFIEYFLNFSCWMKWQAISDLVYKHSRWNVICLYAHIAFYSMPSNRVYVEFQSVLSIFMRFFKWYIFIVAVCDYYYNFWFRKMSEIVCTPFALPHK